LSDNEIALVNLGMAFFCSDNIDAMLSTFERVAMIAPDSYSTLEFLGLAKYYRGEFADAATNQAAAIASIGASGAPEIHDMWGNLADSLRHSGQNKRALSAYKRAAEIVERDFLSGNGRLVDHAHRAFYHSMIAQLSDTAVSNSVVTLIDADLAQAMQAQLGRSGLMRLAQTLKLRKQIPEASAYARRAQALCGGLRQHPDLQGLD
jgi:tetratricopeptide (TPR) repeat protein